MYRLLQIIESSVGQKLIAAVTGLAVVGFLIVHMAGNLQIFAGADALNDYAALLKSQTALLWGARLGLLGLIGLHIAMTVRQASRNRVRQARYARTAFRRTTWASRSMMLTGLLMLAFIAFHLLHFTVGVIQPSAWEQFDDQGRHDVYAMVVAGFRNPWIVGIYVAGMLTLSLHLKHAIASAFQTLGLARDGHESVFRRLSPAVAAVIILGFLAVPLSIASGLVGG